MALSLSEIMTIYEQSSNLAERLGGLFESAEDYRAQGAANFDSWKQVIAGHGDVCFSEIVEALGGSPGFAGTVQRLLGPVACCAGHPLPSWTECLRDISQAVSTNFSNSDGSQIHLLEFNAQKSRIPFWHLFQPIVDLAQKRVVDVVPGARHLLGPRAWKGLQHQLLRRISSVTSSTLHTRFLIHKALVSSGISGLFEEQETSERKASRGAGSEFYTRFVREEGQDGLRQFFLSYPVAARLISTVTQNWIAATAEFAYRFEVDEHSLEKSFSITGRMGRIMQVKCGLSDLHRGGRAVIILRTEGGTWLVYKPRPMQVDVLFTKLLREMNERLPGIQLLPLKVVSRDNYGWQEFAGSSGCRSAAEAKRFYRRAGALVAVVHWLQGIDCHRENIMAVGEHPVLIDLETLGHPPRSGSESFAHIGGYLPFEDSLMRIGLLPLRQSRFEGGTLYDNSGLGAPIIQSSLVEVQNWKEVNTDKMHCVYAKRRSSLLTHRPRLRGQALSPGKYANELWHGFRLAATQFNDDVTGSLAAVREAIYQAPRRRIKRPTLIYAILIRRSLQPDQLTNGLKRSIGLHALPCEPEETQTWAKEIADLERLDIPYFDLPDENAPVSGPERPSFDQIQMSRHQKIINLAVKRRLLLNEGWLHVMGRTNRRRSQPDEPDSLRC